MFFTIWVMFWKIIRIIYSFVAYKRAIKSNYYIIFIGVFPVIFFWWNIYSLPVISICKRFNFCYSLLICFYFFMKRRLLQQTENICYRFYWLDLFIESIYDSAWFRFILWHNTITEHNQRQTHYLSSILNYFDIYF